MTLMGSQLDNQTSRDCGDNHSDLLVLLYSPKDISCLEQTLNEQKVVVVLCRKSRSLHSSP